MAMHYLTSKGSKLRLIDTLGPLLTTMTDTDASPEDISGGGSNPQSHKTGNDELAQRLKTTSDSLKQASRRFGSITARIAKKTGAEVSKAVERTNQSIQTGIAIANERKEQRREEKIAALHEEIKEDGIIGDVPAMVELPPDASSQWEEHAAMIEAQTQSQLELIEQMQLISTRLDDLERRNRALNDNVPVSVSTSPKPSNTSKRVKDGQVVSGALVVLGASLLWVVAILGLDQVINEQGMTNVGKVPLSPVLWAIGTSSWTMYILARLARIGPMLDAPQGLRIQTSLAVGITTLMALVFSDDTTAAMSNVWVWGTVGVVALMLTAGLIASAWRSTKRLVGMDD